MDRLKRFLLYLLLAVFVITVLVVGVGLKLTNFLVDLWWFDSLGYQGYFWLKLLYRYIISGGLTLLFFLIFYTNFRIAARYLGLSGISGEDLPSSEVRRRKSLAEKFATGSMEVYTPLSLLMAVAVAVPFYRKWEQALLFFFAPSTGTPDPIFGRDVGYYLFSYPIYLILQKELLAISILLLLATATLYWLEHRTLSPSESYPRGAKIHLSALVFLIVLIKGWDYTLQRHGLLYVDRHEPAFFGPGLVELWYHMPLIWAAWGFLLLAALFAMRWIHTRRGTRLAVTFGTLYLLSLALRQAAFIPDWIETLIVRPNPTRSQGEFMRYNINATLAAYKLNDVITQDYAISERPDVDIAGDVEQALKNIPLWDQELLHEVYQQLQGIRPYYRFSDVDAARYEVNGVTEQVNLATREVNTSKLPEPAKTWENLRLRYTNGYGAVITPAAQPGEEPMQWYLRDINMVFAPGFPVNRIDQPEVFFGHEDLHYVAVPNKLRVADVSTLAELAAQNYRGLGAGGVLLDTTLRRLLVAFYFRDYKLFFSQAVTEDSHVLFRRNVIERIRHIAPFLTLDGDPYLVVTSRSMQWVVDAYTMADTYPLSKLSTWLGRNDGEEVRRFNYVRNSVKIVVDAYHGTVDFYVSDPEDPIIRAYERAYPGLFKPLDFMLPEVYEQLRYPRDIFYHQMAIYRRYNQTDPDIFYSQPETWDFAKVGEQEVRPYYLTVGLEGCEELSHFLLVSPLTPIGRDNLSALAIAGQVNPDMCSETNLNRIVIYRFPRDMQVEGPSQINALIDQNPEISAQFSLWDQRGSKVIRGRTIILPIHHVLLYVQPVYLVSSATVRFPELARVILTVGTEVVMERTLEGALEKLRVRLREKRLHGGRVTPSDVRPDFVPR